MPTTEEHLVGCLLLGSGSWSSYPDTLDSAHTSAGARLCALERAGCMRLTGT